MGITKNVLFIKSFKQKGNVTVKKYHWVEGFVVLDKPVTCLNDIFISTLFASPGLLKDEMRPCQIGR